MSINRRRRHEPSGSDGPLSEREDTRRQPRPRVTEADGIDDRQVHLDRDCEGTPRFPLVVDFEKPLYAFVLVEGRVSISENLDEILLR
jgi:hypothetical protein